MVVCLIYEGMLVNTLARYRSKPRVYIGCMKSGPVLSKKYVKAYICMIWDMIFSHVVLDHI